MTGGERYLEKQAKRRRQEYLEALPSPRLPPLDCENVPLQDAPSRFRERLHSILHPRDGDGDGDGDDPGERDESAMHLGRTVFASVDVSSFDSGVTDFDSLRGHAATIVGSSQQGKTSLLNSLLNLFGFGYGYGDGELVFPASDLLPTHSKNRAGLPFPLRLQYAPRYELCLQRWDAGRLQDAMCKVAEQAMAQNPEFFEELEQGFESATENSFLEFVAQHRDFDMQGGGGYLPKPSAIEAFEADGGVECPDFASDGCANPSPEAHEALQQFLINLVEDGRWLRYECVVLKCPSQLLKHLNIASEALHETCILDLPGVGIVDDNNSLVEELVLRDVKDARTIVVLTGERSFTQDVLHILRNSVFERLLDPLVAPPPTVAITNSRNLRGLKEEEMALWRAATLNGSLGWNTELKAFAEEVFSERRHRGLQSLEPDLFPNDLEGFLQSRTGAHERGVTMLVGYFLRLPQEALIACVTDVLERARSVMNMVDQLWQAKKISWKGLRSSRLMKEARRLRDEGFLKELDSELTLAAQKKIFGFEEAASTHGKAKTLQIQVQYIQKLFLEQNEKLAQRFEKLKDGKGDLKQDLHRIVKESLLHIASQWDQDVGEHAFDRFLSHGERMCNSLYKRWARNLFPGMGRDGMEDCKQDQAYQFLVNYMNTSASAAIKKGTFKYTWTHGLRLQAWNLDLKDVTKILGVRRGRRTSVAYNRVWSSVQDIMKAKEAFFREHMLEHTCLQSASIKQLIRLMKQVIISTFEECETNFSIVTDTLERIASGRLAISEDPVVTLREELASLVKEVERYLIKHKEMRDSFGAQELDKVLQLQFPC